MLYIAIAARSDGAPIHHIKAFTMTIRRMRSMSGIRRMWSDYGFEGFLREDNLVRAANFGFYSIGLTTLAFSALVWAVRYKQSAPQIEKFRSDLNSLLTIQERDDLVGPVLPALTQRGLDRIDLEVAASHVTPIESQLMIVSYFSSQLRNGSCDIKSLDTTCPDPVVKQILKRSSESTTSTEALIAKVKEELVDHWIAKRYFDSSAFPKRSVFNSRETGEAIGVDIGCTVAPGFVSAESPVLSLDQATLATRMVEQWGFSFVKQALSPVQIEQLRRELRLDQSSASQIGERVVGMDANISHSRAMPNRLHMVLRGSKLESLTQPIHTALVPLVTLLQSRRDPGGESLMVSDVRVVVVDQAAEATNWTLLNPRGGFTAMITLHDRDTRAGTYSLLPGTHFLADKNLNIFRRLQWTFQRFLALPNTLAVTDVLADGCWRAGDALVLDNRLLVQAHENKMFKSGTYLLIKYETPSTAPNKVYLSGKVTFRLAKLMQLVGAWSNPH